MTVAPTIVFTIINVLVVKGKNGYNNIRHYLRGIKMDRLEQAKQVLQEMEAAIKSGTVDDIRVCLKRMQDLNSSFPATEQFLKLRGLRSVAELDQDGIRDLKDHLLAILYPPKN